MARMSRARKPFEGRVKKDGKVLRTECFKTFQEYKAWKEGNEAYWAGKPGAEGLTVDYAIVVGTMYF